MTTHDRTEAALRDACFRLLEADALDAEAALEVAAWKVGPYVNAGLVEDQRAVSLLMAAAAGAGIGEVHTARRIIDLTFERAPRRPDGVAGSPAEGAAAPGRRLHTVSDWEGEAVPERVWLVKDWIPAGATTVLYGDGGAGKSLLAHQLATAVAGGGSFLGMPVRQGPVRALFCEDDREELMRRQASINAATGAAYAGLEDLRLMSAVGEANLLMTFDARSVGELTAWGEQWFALCEAAEPALIIIDTAADTFGGNENSRLEVRQFLSALNALALKTGAAVLLLAHPSLTGLTNGRGHSGSTAWPNGSRSHLYLATAAEGEEEGGKGKDGSKEDPNLRILSRRKANYASARAAIRLLWQAGAFALERPAPTDLNQAERVCLAALRAAAIELAKCNDARADRVTGGVTRVPLSDWRNKAHSLGLTSGDAASSARMAFLRGKTGLKDKGLADFDLEAGWLAVTPKRHAGDASPDGSPGRVGGTP